MATNEVVARLANGAEFGFRDAGTARRLHPDAEIVRYQDGRPYEASDADAPSLSSLTRDELNARAGSLGIEGAADLPNKDAVITAIEQAG